MTFFRHFTRPLGVDLTPAKRWILLFARCLVKNIHASGENLHWSALLIGIWAAFSAANG
jgi:hypothetical protein